MAEYHDEPKTICGWITFVAAAIPACAVGAIGGAASAVQGKPFMEGFEKVLDTAEGVLMPVVEFADKHSDTIIKGVISGAAVALGGATMGKAIDSSKK